MNRLVLFLSFVLIINTMPTDAQPTGPVIQVGPDQAIVTTTAGKLRGYQHHNTYIFKGITYGQAERFMPAHKPESWEGIQSALVYGPVCPIQASAFMYDEAEFAFQHDWGYASEDCLQLNVWTPGINDSKKRPVMVWLHGGGYSAGSSQELPAYDGRQLSEKGDVVLVSINHRLNVLGFLDLSAYGKKYAASANAGMQDIVLALAWVRDNIAAFGGDPNNVTIFGQSGGGGKVMTLMNTPSAKGLFHKAIVQSGVVSQFRTRDITRRMSATLLELAHLNADQVDQLQQMPFEELLAKGNEAIKQVAAALHKEGNTMDAFTVGWGPSVDGNFLPWQPTEAAAQQLAQAVPLLIGSTKHEFMASVYNPQLRHGSKEVIIKFIRTIYQDKTDDYLTAFNTAYPDAAVATDLVDVDTRFRLGVITAANRKATTATAPVYMYLFSWESPVYGGVYKSMHCMELPFVFHNIHRCEEMTGGGPEAYALADKISEAWIRFAHTGNPGHRGLPNWPAYTVQNGELMEFNNTCQVKYHHDRALLEIVKSVN